MDDFDPYVKMNSSFSAVIRSTQRGRIHRHVAVKDGSLYAFINRVVREAIERETGEKLEEAPKASKERKQISL